MNKWVSMLATVLAASICCSVYAFDPSPPEAGTGSKIILKENVDIYQLGNLIQYLEDKDNSFSIDDVRSSKNEKLWLKSRWDVPNFGFSSSAYWLRFGIENTTKENREWFLELGYPLHYEIEFYTLSSDGSINVIKTGNMKSFGERGFKNHNFVFPVSMGIGETKTFYMKSRTSTSIQFPLVFWSSKRFAQEKTTEYGIHFFYYGIVFVMIIYNIVLSFSIRNMVYIYYALYISCFALFQLSFSGLAFQYIWPDYPWLANKSVPFFIGAAFFWLYIFTRSFLETRHIAPKLDYVFLILVILALLTMTSSVLMPYNLSIKMGTYLTLISFPYLAFIGIICLSRGYRPAIFYVLAFFAFFTGGILTASRTLSFVPYNFLTVYGVQVGSALEIILLSLALGDKVRQEQKKKQLEINELNMSLSELNTSLEVKVADQTSELRMANIRLKELDRQKTNFFQNISHEIRTPLTLIMNPIEALTKELPENDNATMALQNAKCLLRLVNQLLYFQKVSSGKLNLKLSPIRLSTFLKSCAEFFIPACGERNIRFISRIPERIDPYMLGQIDALEKIVFNYLSNALKYSPRGGTIELSLYLVKERVRITVSDEGPGISDDNKQKLFNVFSQIEDSNKPKEEGTGLGLALVKELTLAMMGNVFVESVAGKGSTFGVEFLKYDVKRHPMDLLIVDSDADRLMEYCKSLQKAELNICTAQNLREADSKLEEFFFYSILLDSKTLVSESEGLASAFIKKYSLSKILLMNDSSVDDQSDILSEKHLFYKSYKKPLNLNELSTDLKNIMKESNIFVEKIIDLKDYRPREFITGFETDSAELAVEEHLEGTGKLILVVDDIRDMRLLITRVLNSKDYRFITAKNGFEGLEKARLHKPDLIIVDWMMPRLSGPEMLERMAQDEILRSIPTVLLTAKSEEEGKMIAIAKGAHTYLSKPFNEMELFNVIENLIQLKESEEKVKELNQNLTENVLKRYLPHELVEQFISGKMEFDDKPKLMNITVLFADMVGFTQISEEIGTHVASEVLNDYFNAMTDIVFEFGGTVDKFIGDGIMVIFGAPVPTNSETQVHSAIYCAVEMQKTLKELNKKWNGSSKSEFTMRVGIHRGSCIVGSFGGAKRSEYTAIGPTVNMASRIEKAASSGDIFFSSEIRDNYAGKMWKKVGIFDLRGIGKTTLFNIEWEKMERETYEFMIKKAG
ncbi:MAG: response regulator [Oligoflexales bacterium]|nr:response regulator [Oligoflexales bacterium]